MNITDEIYSRLNREQIINIKRSVNLKTEAPTLNDTKSKNDLKRNISVIHNIKFTIYHDGKKEDDLESLKKKFAHILSTIVCFHKQNNILYEISNKTHKNYSYINEEGVIECLENNESENYILEVFIAISTYFSVAR